MVQKLITKDQKTFSGLYDQYADSLYGMICKEIEDRAVADDLLRQTFVLVWQHIGEYDRYKDNTLIWLIRKCWMVTQRYMGSTPGAAAKGPVTKSS